MQWRLTWIFFLHSELLEISELIRLDADVLLNCLTKSDNKWNCLDSDSDLDAINAASIRNSLCRTLYGRLFTWLIGRINESLKVIMNSIQIIILNANRI